MSDPGTWAADAAQAALERRMRAVYRQAQEEIIEKLNKHLKRFMAMDEQKRGQLENGKITPEQYKRWLNGQVFIGKQWQDKVTSVAATLMRANQQANEMIEGKKRAVFGENATFQAYSLEHDAGLDLSFSIYDSATVTRLLKDQPELLPRKVVNGVKDQAWNRIKISNAVTQGIIQGESLPEIAKRIAQQTGSENMKAMARYARTAMTGAQNAGRIEAMHDAQRMGIKVKKKWIATLDSRTRDAHADLDGQVQEVDKPFDSELGKIMYPGDPEAHPGNVWNCRCTLGYVYLDYPERYSQRRAYVEYVDDDGKYHRESHEIANMSYNVWKLAKDRDNQRALENWREKIFTSPDLKVSYLGKLNKDIYKCVTDDISTDEVVITNKQVKHIFEGHPEKQNSNILNELFEAIYNPDYILQDSYEDHIKDTAIVMKHIEQGGYRIILRLATSSDVGKKNSVISAFFISEKKWEKYLRNKKILYKK